MKITLSRMVADLPEGHPMKEMPIDLQKRSIMHLPIDIPEDEYEEMKKSMEGRPELLLELLVSISMVLTQTSLKQLVDKLPPPDLSKN